MQLKSFTDAVDENHMLRSTLGDIVAHILILNTHTSYIYIENRNYKVYLLIHNLIYCQEDSFNSKHIHQSHYSELRKQFAD